MPVLPPFDSRGLLPVGDHILTFDELRHSHLVTGNGNGPTWDTTWRSSLVDGCETLVRQLWQAGVTTVVLDGSFVEDKDHPSDIDGYFDCDLLQLAQLMQTLNALEGHGSWTWNAALRRLDAATGKQQLPMWHRYHTELYPNYQQQSGIVDRDGFPLLFPSAFRQQRATGERKGVLLIVQGDPT